MAQNAVAPGRIMTGRPGSRVDGEDFTAEEARENQLSEVRGMDHIAVLLRKPALGALADLACRLGLNVLTYGS